MLKLQFRGEPEKFVKLSVSTVTVGRDESNDLVIDSHSVSDFHAEITTDLQCPWIIDLLSKTGTFVNEQRITARGELKAWDIIRMGTVELEVVDPNGRRPQDWALRTESDLLASQFYTLGAETVVGRDPECDLAIDSSLLSRRHAKLILESDHLRVIDLDSSNGTYINGEKITEGNAYPGDELSFDRQNFIVIGPSLPKSRHAESPENLTRVRGLSTVMAVAAENPDDTIASKEDDSGNTAILPPDEETRFFVPAPPPALLLDLGSSEQSTQFKLERALNIIGRSIECEFVLDDKSVSKKHAEFSYSDGSWVLRDLGSSNGVFVNGSRVDEVVLETGDTLKLGRRNFEFHIEGEDNQANDLETRIFQPSMHSGAIDQVGSPDENPSTSSARYFLAGIVLIITLAAGVFALWL